MALPPRTRGLSIWLGDGVVLEPERGAGYRTADGTTGEVRSLREYNRVRLTWRPESWTHDTTLQVTVSGSGSKTVLRFHQEWLTDAEERARQRQHWQRVIEEFSAALDRLPWTANGGEDRRAEAQ